LDGTPGGKLLVWVERGEEKIGRVLISIHPETEPETLSLISASLYRAEDRGKRIFPLLYWWIGTHPELTRRFGGWVMQSASARRSAASSAKHIGLEPVEQPLSQGEHFQIRGVFPSWRKADLRGGVEEFEPDDSGTRRAPPTTELFWMRWLGDRGQGQAFSVRVRRTTQEAVDLTDEFETQASYAAQRRVLKRAMAKVAADHPELAERLAQLKVRVWGFLPTLARHNDDQVDLDLRVLRNEVAAALAIRHEAEHAAHPHTGPPSLDEEIAAHRAELDYLLTHFTKNQQDRYLAYLRRTKSINHVAYTNLVHDLRALRTSGASDQQLTVRIRRYIRSVDRRLPAAQRRFAVTGQTRPGQVAKQQADAGREQAVAAPSRLKRFVTAISIPVWIAIYQFLGWLPRPNNLRQATLGLLAGVILFTTFAMPASGRFGGAPHPSAVPSQPAAEVAVDQEPPRDQLTVPNEQEEAEPAAVEMTLRLEQRVERTYIVQPGDTFSTIAKRQLMEQGVPNSNIDDAIRAIVRESQAKGYLQPGYDVWKEARNLQAGQRLAIPNLTGAPEQPAEEAAPEEHVQPPAPQQAAEPPSTEPLAASPEQAEQGPAMALRAPRRLDINADGRVDVKDLEPIYEHYGEPATTPQLERLDVSRDGDINVLDTQTVAFFVGLDVTSEIPEAPPREVPSERDLSTVTVQSAEGILARLFSQGQQQLPGVVEETPASLRAALLGRTDLASPSGSPAWDLQFLNETELWNIPQVRWSPELIEHQELSYLFVAEGSAIKVNVVRSVFGGPLIVESFRLALDGTVISHGILDEEEHQFINYFGDTRLIESIETRSPTLPSAVLSVEHFDPLGRQLAVETNVGFDQSRDQLIFAIERSGQLSRIEFRTLGHEVVEAWNLRPQRAGEPADPRLDDPRLGDLDVSGVVLDTIETHQLPQEFASIPLGDFGLALPPSGNE
ncbi:MAG: dockerin type I domain-containing protein, partial [Candidatus Omnitrophota bacterium]|nr:dockerin type I domain-containing protein [Candidatus Omnitrophota bacterium]